MSTAAYDTQGLALVPRGKNTKEPTDKNSPGWFVYQIVGGKKAIMSREAEALGVVQSFFSNVLHGVVNIPAKRRDKWMETLAQHHPETFKIYGEGLKEAVAKYKPKKRVRGQVLSTRERVALAAPSEPKPVEKPVQQAVAPAPERKSYVSKKDWRRAAGDFINELMHCKGDDLDLVARDSQPVSELKNNPHLWRKIGEGDSGVAVSLYIRAMQEVCVQYDLQNAREPKRYQRGMREPYKNAQRIIRQLQNQRLNGPGA